MRSVNRGGKRSGFLYAGRMNEETATTAGKLALLLADACPRHRIDLAGAVALPCDLPNADRFAAWVAEGRDGGLDYMTRDPETRLDPTRRNPEVRSLLVFAQRYRDGWPAHHRDPAAGGRAPAGAPWTDRVSRYARGRDYHDVFLGDIRALLQDLQAALPGLVAHASTDTGPYLEREYAWLAGLGFLGRNTCLIHERLGSGMFLGVAVTNLEITGLPEQQTEPLYAVLPRRDEAPEQRILSACGRCTACIDACPTAALLPEGGMDASRCLSNFTIEQRGATPEELKPNQGGTLFGCDICQAVCPWNQKAERARPGRDLPPVRDEYASLPEHAELDLAQLATITDEEFRRRFRRTPLWRCHPEGLRRNAHTVLANLGEPVPDEPPDE